VATLPADKLPLVGRDNYLLAGAEYPDALFRKKA